MPKGYIIGHVTVTDPESYPEYIRRNSPVLAALGAKFLVRGGTSEVPEGQSHDRHVVVEFPGEDRVRLALHIDDITEETDEANTVVTFDTSLKKKTKLERPV